nr:hypothetical protein [uncultured Carboxylicivirga sp.]
MYLLFELKIDNFFFHLGIAKYVFLAIILIGVSVFLFIQSKQLNDSSGLLEEYLKGYYRSKGLELLSISKMTMTDRVKYRIPVSPFVSLLNTGPSLFMSRQPIKIYRVLETSNEKGTEFLHYVEIIFLEGGDFSVSEFDSYEF